jgi:hypothetical protein
VRRTLIAIALIATFFFPRTTVEARATNCGRNDKPETGLQGEVPLKDQLSGRALKGYNCGLALVGHASLKGAAGNVAWAGHCAYVATMGEGVNVVDVSDPQHPKRTAVLNGPGSNFGIETIAAKQIGNRAILLAGRYGYFAREPISTAPMDIYDATNCAHPKLLTTFRWPENIHNLTISPDGGRVYATLPLQAADIRDPLHPRYLGNIENDLVGGPLGPGGIRDNTHEVQTSADGNTIYFGGQTPMSAGFTIADVTGYPQRKPRLISRVEGRGHSINVATINGRTYAVHSEESIAPPTSRGCISQNLNPFAGAAQPWLSDLTDQAHPRMRVSRLTLAISKKENCARQVLDSENASVHYHDVDDPQHTTFVMASMWNAGLRIFDVRDPLHPREAAYFNPGMFLRPSEDRFIDKAWGHVRYDAERGQMWFATQGGGFWVVELEPQLRAQLGLSPRPVLHPNGAVPRPAWMRKFPTGSTIKANAAAGPYYCTLSAAQTL